MRLFRAICLMIYALAALHCGAGQEGRRTVVTTFYPMYITALNVTAGVKGIQLVSLAPPSTGCLHDYLLTTRDMAVLSKADVVVANGAGMDSSLCGACSRWPTTKVIDLSAHVDLLVESGVTNSHVWVSPRRHIVQVQALADGLAEWDPGHSALYRTNAACYVEKLRGLQARMEQGLKGVRTRDIITFHEAFPYFASDFNLRVVAVIEHEPGAEPSPGELAAIIRRVRRGGVKVLFVEPQYPAKAAEAIAAETGARLCTLDPVVSGPASADAYLDAMGRNLEELVSALK